MLGEVPFRQVDAAYPRDNIEAWSMQPAPLRMMAAVAALFGGDRYLAMPAANAGACGDTSYASERSKLDTALLVARSYSKSRTITSCLVDETRRVRELKRSALQASAAKAMASMP